MEKQTDEQLQAACDDFNAKHAVGEYVRYWSGPREGTGKIGRINWKAQVMGGHTAVVYIEAVGSVPLTHVAALETAMSGPAFEAVKALVYVEDSKLFNRWVDDVDVAKYLPAEVVAALIAADKEAASE